MKTFTQMRNAGIPLMRNFKNMSYKSEMSFLNSNGFILLIYIDVQQKRMYLALHRQKYLFIVMH